MSSKFWQIKNIVYNIVNLYYNKNKMNTKVNVPIEIIDPNENEEVLHDLPDYRELIHETLLNDKSMKRAKSYKRRLRQKQRRQEKIKMKMKETNITVHLSWDINKDSVKNRMKEHMEAYPETAKGFYARFIDYTDEDTWYIVVPCHKNESNNIDINWLYYKIYPFWDHLNKFIKIFAKDICDILNWDTAEDKKIETINKRIKDILQFSPLDEKWIEKFKDNLVDMLLRNPKLLNSFWKKKYIILDCINNAFRDI